jgi:hypothetical protein
MRITHEHEPAHIPDAFDNAGTSMKKILYWILVFLALICVVCIGIIVIHWSINWRMA